MPGKRYRAVRKGDRKGADVWGVATFEPRPGKPWRQVAWKTIARGEKAELEARVLAVEMERQEAENGERLLQFGERLIARLGRLDLRDLREEDIAALVTAEFKDSRAKDLTINACVLPRSVMLAALAARDASGSHSPTRSRTKRPSGITADQVEGFNAPALTGRRPPGVGLLSWAESTGSLQVRTVYLTVHQGQNAAGS